MIKHIFFLAVILVLWTVTEGQTKVEDNELFASSATDCATIIAGSRWGGDCCALNSTMPNNGCLLTVINGRCEVRGQWWTLDFTSTFDSGGAVCPPSEYNGFLPAPAPSMGGGTPTMAPSAGWARPAARGLASLSLIVCVMSFFV